ncbi:MAG: PAS domain-containing protein [Clostridia bacterium]|nr:MAG: PAS domain-containing protein [Clostridia bacterium]
MASGGRGVTAAFSLGTGLGAGLVVYLLLGWWPALLAGVLASALACQWLAERYRTALQQVVQVAGEIAAGNMEARANPASFSGELAALATALGEIAQRQRAALRDLVRERDTVQAILNSMSEGLVAVDQVSRVIVVNAAAEDMFGIAQEAVCGRYILEVVRHTGLDACVTKVLETGEAVAEEMALFPGQPNSYRLQVSPIKQDGERVVGAVIMVQDVTALRQLEKMRTEFVANVSHELRTPLTSIKGFVETLLDGAVENVEVSRRFLEIILAETERLQKLIEDLFTLSWLESRRLEVPEEGADVGVAVGRIVELLGPQAEAKEIGLAMEIPPDLPPVRMSPQFLHQVLVNLVDNAINYTLPGGRVKIAAAVCGHEVKLEVQDTGIGIPPEDQARVFERFYRIDKARSRALGGTGLGLAIVKHILENHGGRVSVASVPGEGSTFTCFIPFPG